MPFSRTPLRRSPMARRPGLSPGPVSCGETTAWRGRRSHASGGQPRAEQCANPLRPGSELPRGGCYSPRRRRLAGGRSKSNPLSRLASGGWGSRLAIAARPRPQSAHCKKRPNSSRACQTPSFVSECFSKSGRHREAGARYRNVLTGGPDARLRRMAEARALMMEGRDDEAERKLRRAVAIEPNDAAALSLLGSCCRTPGRS